MIHESSSGGSFVSGTLPSSSASRRRTFTGQRAQRIPTSHPLPLPRQENINRHPFTWYARVNGGRFKCAIRTVSHYT